MTFRHPSWFAVVAAAAVVLIVVWIVVLIFGRTTSTSKGVDGSGVAATQTRSVAPFTAVELSGASDVSIEVGPARSVVVHGDDNLLAKVTTHVTASRLVIGTEGSFSTKTPMRVDVTVPDLAALTLSGSGTVLARNVKGDSFKVSLSGSGSLQATGSVHDLVVELPGSGEANLYAVNAQDVHAELSGSGQILVHAAHSVIAVVSGSGSIVYAGNPPSVTKSVTGSGAVVPG